MCVKMVSERRVCFATALVVLQSVRWTVSAELCTFNSSANYDPVAELSHTKGWWEGLDKFQVKLPVMEHFDPCSVELQLDNGTWLSLKSDKGCPEGNMHDGCVDLWHYEWSPKMYYIVYRVKDVPVTFGIHKLRLAANESVPFGLMYPRNHTLFEEPPLFVDEPVVLQDHRLSECVRFNFWKADYYKNQSRSSWSVDDFLTVKQRPDGTPRGVHDVSVEGNTTTLVFASDAEFLVNGNGEYKLACVIRTKNTDVVASFRYKSTLFLKATLSSVICLFIFLIGISFYIRRWLVARKISLRPLLSPMTSVTTNPVSIENQMLVYTDLEMALIELTQSEPEWIEKYNVAEVDRSQTTIGKKLGSGHFGDVHIGTVHRNDGMTIDVAIKVNHYDPDKYPITFSDRERELSLLREAEAMARVRGHSHVINLQGIMVDFERGRRIHLIMGLCTNQSLRDYLSANGESLRLEANDHKKMQWAQQISNGMLHLKRNDIVHLDLAARNILLTHPTEIAKISDFGLAQFQDESSEATAAAAAAAAAKEKRRRRRGRFDSCATASTYTDSDSDDAEAEQAAASAKKSHMLPLYQLPPDVWTNVESATSATDVWSFGILLWELFTAGSSPLDYMKGVMRRGPRFQSFQDFLHRWVYGGHRLPSPWPLYRPLGSPNSDTIYHLMSRCWSLDPSTRPSFEELDAKFTALVPREDLQAVMARARLEDHTYQVTFKFVEQGQSHVQQQQQEQQQRDHDYLSLQKEQDNETVFD